MSETHRQRVDDAQTPDETDATAGFADGVIDLAEAPPIVPAPPLSKTEVRTILLSLMLTMFLTALDQTIVATALPTIGQQFRDVSNLSWVITAYLLSSTAVAPVYGALADIYGRRAMIITANVLFLIGSVLCALAWSIHMTLLGEKGLRQLAALNHEGASAAAERLAQVPGVELATPEFFNEFTLKLSKEARPVVRELADKGILAGVSLGRLYPGEDSLANGLVVAVTETTTAEDVATLAAALEEVLA